MSSFRKKPVVIEAIQWTGDNSMEVLDFGNDGPMPLWGDDFTVDMDKSEVYILTLEGKHTATKGDWIIRGIKGEFYPCQPDIFEATYEPAAQPEKKTPVEP